MKFRDILRAFPLPLLPVLFAFGCASGTVLEPPVDLEQPPSLANLDALVNAPVTIPSPDDYRIGPGDVLEIQLIGRPDVLGGGSGIDITDNPTLTLPLIGTIRIHGKTPRELEAELREAYSQLIIDPQPSVIIKKFANFQVAVLGLVVSPMKYPFEPGDTLQEVVFKAGGLVSQRGGVGAAPGRYLKIYREKFDAEGRAASLDARIEALKTGRNLPREDIAVPIEEFIQSGLLRYDLPVLPNDIIYIPPAGAVHVQGHLNSQGVTFLGPSLRTLTQVVTARGGIRFGAKSRAEVVRIGADGRPEVHVMNIRRMLKRQDPDFVLKDGDQIFIDPHWFRRAVEWVGGTISRGTAAGINATATYNPVAPGL